MAEPPTGDENPALWEKEGQIRVVVQKGVDLPANSESADGVSVIASLGENEGRTQTVRDDKINPKWNAAFQFPYEGEHSVQLEAVQGSKVLADGIAWLGEVLRDGHWNGEVTLEPSGKISVLVELIERPPDSPKRLTVGIGRSAKLYDPDPKSPLAPYVKIFLGDQEVSNDTTTREGPESVWAEKFDYDYDNEQQIRFEVHDSTTKKFCAMCAFDLWIARKGGKRVVSGNLPLVREGNEASGNLFVSLIFWDPESPESQMALGAVPTNASEVEALQQLGAIKEEEETPPDPPAQPAATSEPAPTPTAADPGVSSEANEAVARAQAAAAAAKRAADEAQRIAEEYPGNSEVQNAKDGAVAAAAAAAAASKSASDHAKAGAGAEAISAADAACQGQATAESELLRLLRAQADADAERAKAASERAQGYAQTAELLSTEYPDSPQVQTCVSGARDNAAGAADESLNAASASGQAQTSTTIDDTRAHALKAKAAADEAERLADEILLSMKESEKAEMKRAKKEAEKAERKAAKGSKPPPSRQLGIQETKGDGTPVVMVARKMSVRSVQDFHHRGQDDMLNPDPVVCCLPWIVTGVEEGPGAGKGGQFQSSNFSITPHPVIEGEAPRKLCFCCGIRCPFCPREAK